MAEDNQGNTPLFLAHSRLKKMKQNFSSSIFRPGIRPCIILTNVGMRISDVQEELQYIIDVITAFVEKHGSIENRSKLATLKTRIAQALNSESIDEVDMLLADLTL